MRDDQSWIISQILTSTLTFINTAPGMYHTYDITSCVFNTRRMVQLTRRVKIEWWRKYLCSSNHKKKKLPFRPYIVGSSHLEPLPPSFSCTRFRNSAMTPASPLIKKCPTLRWTLSCAHYSVAKRHQFWWPASTVTAPPKFENMVQESWIFSFSYRGQAIFLLM